MTRAAEVARTFIADETLSREVESLAEAVDSADVPYVEVGRVLTDLRVAGGAMVAELAGRMGSQAAKDALVRLQDLGLVVVSAHEDGDRVALTPAGTLAADCDIVDG